MGRTLAVRLRATDYGVRRGLQQSTRLSSRDRRTSRRRPGLRFRDEGAVEEHARRRLLNVERTGCRQMISDSEAEDRAAPLDDGSTDRRAAGIAQKERPCVTASAPLLSRGWSGPDSRNVVLLIDGTVTPA